MAETKRKGDLGQTIIMAKIMLSGHKVAMPVGEDWRFDLIALKDGKLVRVQCKYVTSNGEFVRVPCKSANSHAVRKYTPEEIDWLVCYDATSERCFYIPSSMLGKNDLSLRLTPPKNGATKNVRWAKDFETW